MMYEKLFATFFARFIILDTGLCTPQAFMYMYFLTMNFECGWFWLWLYMEGEKNL